MVKNKIINEPKFINSLLTSVRDFLYDLSNQWKIAGKINWANSLFTCAKDLEIIIEDLAEVEDQFFLDTYKDRHPSELKFNSVEDVLNISKEMKKDLINHSKYFYIFTELHKDRIISIFSKELSALEEKYNKENKKPINKDLKESLVNFLEDMKRK